MDEKRTKEHHTSLAYRLKRSGQDLNEWILKFYVHRLAFYSKNIGQETTFGVIVTPRLLQITRERYLTLLMRKHNVTIGQLPRINK